MRGGNDPVQETEASPGYHYRDVHLTTLIHFPGLFRKILCPKQECSVKRVKKLTVRRQIGKLW